MIYYLISLLILLFNIFINRSINKRLLYPPTLYSMIWFVVLFFHCIAAESNYLGIEHISIYSLIIFTIGPCVFTIGGYIGFFNSKKRINVYYEQLYINKKFLNGLMILSTVLLPLYAYESYQIVMANSITGDFMRDLRLNLNTGEASRKYMYGIILAYFLFFICLYLYLIKYKHISRKRLIYSTIILLLYMILSTGRTAFLQFFVLILGTISTVRVLKIRFIINSIIGFIGLFFTYGFMLEKGTSKDASFFSNINSMIENFSVYFLGGISAFNYKMINGFNFYYGDRTFRFPVAVLNNLGLINSSPQVLVEEYVRVPFSTNVYTIYLAYIEDFGVFYVIISFLIISYLVSNFFGKSIVSNRFRLQYTYIYSLLLYPIVMSFFQDQFISLFATWFYAIILLLISTKFIYYKKI